MSDQELKPSPGQQTRAVVFAEPKREASPPAEWEEKEKEEGQAKSSCCALDEKEDPKADSWLAGADDAAVATCTPETLTGNTEEETSSTSAASSWAPYGVPGGGFAAPDSPGRPQFSKRINRTSLLFVSVPKAQAHHFPATGRIVFVPRGTTSDIGSAMRVTCSRPKGTKFLCRGWADFVHAQGLAVGDVVNFVMSKDNTLKWEFTISRLNLWAQPREASRLHDDEVRCMTCGRQDSPEQLILCEGQGCGRAFHQRCRRRQLVDLPGGDVLCDVCTSANAGLGSSACMMCGRRGERGEMLVCSAKDCLRVCHLGCSRPPLKSMPEEEWVCMLCRPRSCIVCNKRNDTAKMLLCDGELCSRACHLRCIRPSLDEVPEDEWFCNHCQRRNSGLQSCMVCAKHDMDSPLLVCNGEFCGRVCHMQCASPPLKEVPETWFCALCQCAGTFDAQCMVCNRRDGEANLLLCDGIGCTRACHLRCCNPPLKKVPAGDWFCELCKLEGNGVREALPPTSCMVCGRCDKEDELLLCDGPDCTRACHLRCCKPPLQRVPQGEWYCELCQPGIVHVDTPSPSPQRMGAAASGSRGYPQQPVLRHSPPSVPPPPPPFNRGVHDLPRYATSGLPRPLPKRKVSNEGAKRCVAFGEALKLASVTVVRPMRPCRY